MAERPVAAVPAVGGAPDAPPATFEREQGCTETEWLRWLPVAAGGGRAVLQHAPGSREARLLLPGGGALHLAWQPLEPRRIALIAMPRMRVAYRFDDAVAPDARRGFLRWFDLVLQRGGG